ncbi:hypothetical protein TSAR_003925 [Trichomalopsis sarcophagae]|uniref:Uncharacterized protein n=1 Tax=Trichomalopsis sarcophagae TaxID=543379 RepID=A0A232EZQ0_9HYME|nr:hypothetical protein TSAR_003925 [Trichomalopsis sarcophagae]
MDFPRPIQNATFTKIRNVLFKVTLRVADNFMSEAVEEELRHVLIHKMRYVYLKVLIQKLLVNRVLKI